MLDSVSSSARAFLARAFIIAIVTLQACGAGSEQARELEVTVSPDTMRVIPQDGTVFIKYTLRTTAEIELLTRLGPEVQAELSPDAWTTLVVPGKADIQSGLRGIVLQQGYSAELGVNRQLQPGRYRLLMTYRPSQPSVTATGPSIDVVSNRFVVLP
jgi:hypothetical protein